MAAEKAAPKEDGKKGEPSKDDAKGKKKEEKKEAELSDEDLALKENLELMVTRSSDSKAGVAKLAMQTMRSEIKSSTRSVPKRNRDLTSSIDACHDLTRAEFFSHRMRARSFQAFENNVADISPLLSPFAAP